MGAETAEFQLSSLLPGGFECPGCIERLQDALGGIPGIELVEIDQQAKSLRLVYDPDLVPLSRVQEKARATGIKLQSNLAHETYTVAKLHCTDCAVRVEGDLKRCPGVHWASANFAAKTVHVAYHPQAITVRRIRECIERAVGEAHSADERTVSLQIEGMDCAGCADSIRAGLLGLDGVVSCQVDFVHGKATVTFASHILNEGEIVDAISKLGYSAQRSDTVQDRFTVSGMDCADCAEKIRRALMQRQGVVAAEVSFASGLLSVEYRAGETGREDIIRTVAELGYSILSRPTAEQPAGAWAYLRQRPRLVSTIVCGLATAGGLVSSWAGLSDLVVLGLFGLAIVVGGYYIARSAVSTLRASLVMDMNLLMTIAVVGAIAIGQWSEAAAVVFLFSVASALESYTSDRTRNAVRSLMDLSPEEATVVERGQEYVRPVEGVEIGSTIVVKPGQRIPMDGIVQEGDSEVDESPLTGESQPVHKQAGDGVFAGTINGSGLLRVKVTKRAHDRTITRIIQMVEEAQAHKSPSQRFVDVFAMYYTPAVIVVAALVVIGPPLLLGQPLRLWVYRGLTLLVLSCPCALVISTPVAIAAAIANGARNGVLVKGGVYIERMGQLAQMAFDKTGTLTQGRPQVTDVMPAAGVTEKELVQTAAAVEAGSEHTLAQAIVAHARSIGLQWPAVRQLRATPGKGVSAVLDGCNIHVGQPSWLQELNVDLEEVAAEARRLQESGKTVVVVGRVNAHGESDVLGVIGIADAPRPVAGQAIRRLRKLGIQRMVMLTGDNEQVAAAIARQLCIDEYRASLLPDEKVEALKELRKDGTIAMVGDGVNDAPALAAADIGVAMGAAGTDAALETADIALMGDDLNKLAYTVRLGRRTLKIVKQNIAASIILKLLFVALVFPGWLTLWLAILGDTGVAIGVTLNSMRVLRLRDHGDKNCPRT